MTLDVSLLDGATYDNDHAAVVTSVDVTNNDTYTISSSQWDGTFDDTEQGDTDPSTQLVAITTTFDTPAEESAGVVDYTYYEADGSTTYDFYGQVLGYDATDDLYLIEQYQIPGVYFPGEALNPNNYLVLSGDINGPGSFLSGYDGNPADDSTDLSFTLPAIFTACYCAGTSILTQRGEVPVEQLRVGDRVVTLADGGALKPVIWIGHSTIDIGRHPRPAHVTPVRISAGAIAPGMPHRDLLVSPEHAIGLCAKDGRRVLVPAVYLVNGATILHEPPTGTVRYFHVELERHDMLLADGLPAESYLDTGNRNAFANAGVNQALHADFRPGDWERDSCAPLLLGAEAAPLHARLLERAEALGHAMTTDPDLVVETGGTVLTPLWHRGGEYVYLLPPSTIAVKLLSRVAVPNDMDARNADRRPFGVAVARLVLDGVEVGLDDMVGESVHSGLFADGFLQPECDGVVSWRWTNGAATLVLPASLHETVLELTLHENWMRYWLVAQAPAASARRA